MTLSERIVEDLKTAMKAKDGVRTSCLRLLKTSLKNLQVEKGRPLTDEDVLSAISSMIRKDRDAVAEYRKAGRDDLAAKEEAEIHILYDYLPKQLSPEEIEAALREIITEVSASSPKDLGRVMKEAMARMAGQAQGKEINQIARRLLA